MRSSSGTRRPEIGAAEWRLSCRIWRFGRPWNRLRGSSTSFPSKPFRLATPPPLLFIHAGGDMMVPVAESKGMWERSTEPTKLVVIPDIDHHAVHSGEPFEQVISEIDSWLGDHIAGPGA